MELETIHYLKFVLALLFVLGLIGGFAIIAKRAGLGNRGPMIRGKKKRLSIIETMALDPKRRVILVQCDNSEYLLLVGANGEQVINQNSDHQGLIETNLQTQSFLKAIEKPHQLAS